MLKIIGIILMTLDHIGFYLHDHISAELYFVLRAVGRLAFPIFVLYLVKGFSRTSNPARYTIRMASWALVTHLSLFGIKKAVGQPASILDFSWTNIMVLFTFALIMLAGYDLAMKSYHDMVASMHLVYETPGENSSKRFDVKINIGGISLSPQVGISVGVLLILASLWFARFFKADYGVYGMLLILLCYIAYNKEEDKISYLSLTLSWFLVNVGNVLMALAGGGGIKYELLQSLSLLAVALFYFVPDFKSRPSRFQKYFFYFYYPAHILILILISASL